MEDVTKMNFRKFKKRCKERIFDGNWEINEALISFKAIAEVDKIKETGFFGKIKSSIAKEKEWQKIRSELM